MKLNDKLICLREKAGLSQLTLAERLNVSRQTISKWEGGIVSPTRNNLKAIAEVYGVSMDWLCDDSDEPYVNPQLTSSPPTVSTETEKKQAIHATNATLRWIIGLIALLIVLVSIVLYLLVSEQTKSKPIDTLPTKTIDPEETPVDHFGFTW